eukprot:TRINITY_DN7524_c0_g2_i1.p1 TRINITY_DN7524_c0_g2~~TRINITY_DN7524_c0_g2_i1.p1  ORF type:complete len:140 (+),score=31.24 TRINITY_DN7524_c0_g2_i1:31-450(+)
MSAEDEPAAVAVGGAGGGGEPVFSLPELLQLVGGSPSIADLILQKFVTLAPDTFKRIQDLASNPSEASCADLRREAHSLKGSSSYIFAKKLTAVCLEMQTAAELCQLDAIPALMNRMQVEFELVDKEIKAHLAKQSQSR